MTGVEGLPFQHLPTGWLAHELYTEPADFDPADPDSVMQPVVDHWHTGVVQREDRMHQHRVTAVCA
jgi:hypothetical protein